MLEFITPEFLAFSMFIVTIGFLLAGYPVAFTLAGSAVLFALIGAELELFNPQGLLGRLLLRWD